MYTHGGSQVWSVGGLCSSHCDNDSNSNSNSNKLYYYLLALG